MSNSEKDNNIYVFLSHSHHDYEKVRVVRDLLEDGGFRPLMFFLKCLEKDEYDELTQTLIKEEIDSRQRFVLCKSNNANKSKWVQFEVDYIKKRQRPYETVDLDTSIDVQKRVLLQFKRRSTVFLSYLLKQSELADLTRQELNKNDFETFDIKSFVVQEDISNAIEKASKEGYVLFFLDGTISKYMYYEISYARKNNGFIIPIVLSDAGLRELEELYRKYPLKNLQSIDVRNIESPSNTAQIIVEKLIQIDMKLNQ